MRIENGGLLAKGTDPPIENKRNSNAESSNGKYLQPVHQPLLGLR